MQRLELGAHLDPQLGVEVREGLVEEEHGRTAHERAPHRDPLALAAREGTRLAVEEPGDSQDLCCALDLGRDPRVLFPPRGACGEASQEAAVLAPPLERERHVLAHREVRVEGVVLEDHRHVTVTAGDLVHDPVADAQGPAGDLLEACDHAQGGALAAARGPDQDDELPVLHGEVHALHGTHSPRVDLGDLIEVDACHQPFTAPFPRPSMN